MAFAPQTAVGTAHTWTFRVPAWMGGKTRHSLTAHGTNCPQRWMVLFLSLDIKVTEHRTRCWLPSLRMNGDLLLMLLLLVNKDLTGLCDSHV